MASRNMSAVRGLTKKPFSKACSRSVRSDKTDRLRLLIMTNAGALRSPNRRNTPRSVSQPSMSGISQSTNRASKGCKPCSRLLRRMSSASAPECASRTCHPKDRINVALVASATGLSSTSKVWRTTSVIGADRASGSTLSCAATGSSSSKLKVLPCPSVLASSSSLPINRTSRVEMTSPRPVPPKRRVVLASAWVKASKMRA